MKILPRLTAPLLWAFVVAFATPALAGNGHVPEPGGLTLGLAVVAGLLVASRFRRR